MTSLRSLKNIGDTTAVWLNAVGIHSEDDLIELGPVEAYRRVKDAFPEKATLNLLYALQGALLDLPWNELPPDLKAKLKRAGEFIEEKGGTQLFDRWAANYDRSVESSKAQFPFDGYNSVLEETVKLAKAQSFMKILDVGTGTANLAKRFLDLGCAVWGIDSSPETLKKAEAKAPQARFIQVNLLEDWHEELEQRFDRIVSAYFLHEYDLITKVAIIRRLVDNKLDPDGRIVIADISFPTVDIRQQARQRWEDLWDDSEHYWAADETHNALQRVGLQVNYHQISSCGGIYVLDIS